MTPDEINAEVAKLCGIELIPCTCTAWPWKDKSTGRHSPDFYHSRDACAEFETALDDEEHRDYRLALGRIIVGFDDGLFEMTPAQARQWFCATPAQRCEAFLRLNDKWRE